MNWIVNTASAISVTEGPIYCQFRIESQSVRFSVQSESRFLLSENAEFRRKMSKTYK